MTVGDVLTDTTGCRRAYFYYRCSKKHKTAGQGCSLRDVPAHALESFVLDQIAAYSVDAEALRRSVSEANVGRDTTLAALVAELGEVEAAILQKRKQIAKVLDVLESDEGEESLSTLRDRLKSREAELAQMTERRIDLQNRRDALEREVLEMTTVASTFTQLPQLFDEARRQNAHQELRELLRAVIDVVEWRQDKDSPKKGEAFIQLYPLPNLLAPSGVNRDADSSSGCHEWLPIIPIRRTSPNAGGN